MRRVKTALRRVAPGRLVMALPWPEERGELRIFRDYVLPHLERRPACLFMGAPSRNEARMVFGAELLRQDVRVLTGRVDADLIAAVARCVDAFVVLPGREGAPAEDAGELAVAMAMGGTPVVTARAEHGKVLAHERSAFVLDRDDHAAMIETTNRLLGLPAVQRHALGEEFARHTSRSRGGWDSVAEAYAERFAALVGRPRIPVEWRAAAAA
jgi:hypothetical protein